MPPRKEKLPKLEFRQLIRNYGIRFEGPVPPREWPDQHKHHFQVIREISTIRYDDYKVNERIPKERRKDFQKRVNYLREKAYNLLDDVKANEATWRELELSILKRFDERVICGKCSHELWKSDFEADVLHVEHQAELKAKRLRRKMCCCKNGRTISRTENNDDENRAIFDFAKEEVITHAFDDDLQNVSIHMKPDRVIGLRAPSRIPQNASHFPVTGRRILLPFLVVEAKKEEDAPGFRAIQYQTAFPVRRLLKAQDDLRSRELSSEPSLVWFFAYQGEQWRLHTGIRENDRVKIYDLWQGTIQSQDDALQLLLIVDYIWSWARDIYRPFVRKLFESITSFRDFSPASTDRFRQSASLCSAPSPAPTTHNLDLMQIDQVVVDTERPGGPHQRVDHGSPESEKQETAVIKDTNFHAFLKWAVGHELAPSWTEIGSIRYSNIVHFEFRWLNVWEPEIVKVKRADPDGRSIFDILSALAFWIHPEQLYELAALWTTNFAPVPELDLRYAVHATIFFQTYCDQSTWQIKRVLNCILWRTEPFTPSLRADIDHLPAYVGSDGKPDYFEMNDLRTAILDTQQIYGRDSVWYALRNLSMALILGEENRGPEWISFDETEMPDKTSGFLIGLAEYTDLGEIVISCINRCGSLSQIDPGFERRLPSTIPDLGRDMRNGDSMLAVRSPSWPAVCPRFCLFVLLEGNHDDKDILYQLLEEAIALKNFYGEGNCRFNRSDWQALRGWRKALKDGD